MKEEAESAFVDVLRLLCADSLDFFLVGEEADRLRDDDDDAWRDRRRLVPNTGLEVVESTAALSTEKLETLRRLGPELPKASWSSSRGERSSSPSPNRSSSESLSPGSVGSSLVIDGNCEDVEIAFAVATLVAPA